MNSYHKYSIKSIFVSIFVSLSLLVVIDNQFNNRPINGVIACALVLIACFIDDRKGERYTICFHSIVQFITITWLVVVLCGIVNGDSKILQLATLEPLLYSGFLTYLMYKGDLFLFPIKVVFYFATIYLYYICFVLGNFHYDIFDHQSGGGITILLLSLAIPIQLMDYKTKGRINLLPPILIIPLAVYGWNRSGLFASVLYFLSVAFVGLGQMERKGLRNFFIVTITATVAVLIFRYWYLFEGSDIYAKFGDENSGGWSGRDVIWLEYLQQINLMTLLFGVPVNEVDAVVGFTNMHNSYLNLHSQSGLWGLIIIASIISLTIRYCKNNKFTFCLLLVLLLRSMTDMVYFFSYYDFSLFLFFFGEQAFISKSNNIKLKIL